MSQRTILVVDLQNDYFKGGKWPLVKIDESSQNAARIIAVGRDLKNTVIHIRHEFESSDAPFFTPNSEGARIHKKVAPLEGEKVILKHSPNSFQNTDLREILDREMPDELVIIGAMTHICIDATVRAASDFGYKVTVVHDACASSELEFAGTRVAANLVHAAFMSSLGFCYAKVVSTAEFLETLDSRRI